MPTPLPRVSYRVPAHDTRGFWSGGFVDRAHSNHNANMFDNKRGPSNYNRANGAETQADLDAHTRGGEP